MTSQIKVKNIKKQNNDYDHNQIFKQMFTSKSVIALKISFKKHLNKEPSSLARIACITVDDTFYSVTILYSTFSLCKVIM